MKRYIKSSWGGSRWNKLEDQGYTVVHDSGYASNKEEFVNIRQDYESKGMKVLRIATDTPGLINYIVLKQPE